MCCASTAQAQFDDLAKWVPDSANSIVLVQAKNIFDSQIAEKENWKSERAKAFKAGAGIIPPNTRRFLMASQVDFQMFENIWQVAVFDELEEIDMAKLSGKTGGSIESLLGHEAVVAPNDAYLVKVEPKKLALMAPANRQMASRWIRSSENGQMRLSPYLANAVKFADTNAHVIVAFDLTDVIHDHSIEERLKQTELYKTGSLKGQDMSDLCAKLAGIKGLTLGITINDKISGAIKIDFKERPTTFAIFGKDLLLHVLKQRGLMIDDIDEWVMNINDDNLTFRGEFSREGLRQVSFLIEQPLAAGQDAAYGDESSVDPKTRSVQYFRAVDDLVDDMRGKVGKAKALKTYAKWFEKYARQIDELSVIGVDEELLSFGTTTADSFRQITGILRGAEYNRLGTRENMGGTYSYAYGGGYNNYGYRRGGYAYSYRRVQTAEQRNIEGQAKLAGANKANEVMRDIDEASAKVRKSMSQKYKFNF